MRRYSQTVIFDWRITKQHTQICDVTLLQRIHLQHGCSKCC